MSVDFKKVIEQRKLDKEIFYLILSGDKEMLRRTCAGALVLKASFDYTFDYIFRGCAGKLLSMRSADVDFVSIPVSRSENKDDTKVSSLFF